MKIYVDRNVEMKSIKMDIFMLRIPMRKRRAVKRFKTLPEPRLVLDKLSTRSPAATFAASS
jgi:hypothetical protein